jgi:(2Fe-2S) ferredoxin
MIGISRLTKVLSIIYKSDAKMETIAEKIHLKSFKKHIFLCADQSQPKCCSKEDSLIVWEHLKKRLDELGLSKQGGIFRSKANCLRACMQGPIAVIYPEAVWYHSVTCDVIDRIIKEHIIGGNIVSDYQII